MAHTVIGLFENESAAQVAAKSLQAVGISRDNVDVSRNTGSYSGTGSERESENGITRFFKSLFGDNDDDAKRYSKVSNSSCAIVTVHAQSRDEAEVAANLLDENGALDVDEAAQYSGDSRGISFDRNNESEATINRVEEELQVGKREVERGSVQVRSRIVERPVEETLRLREEHVSIERHDVNRPVTSSDLSAFEDRDIELTERAEVPVVNKEARVVEEIKIKKDVTERNETIRDTVRNTEVDIDNIDGDERTGRDLR